MAGYHLYGISNCDTVRKARRWLHEHAIEVHWHDFKQQPPSHALLADWIAQVGWQALLKKTGTTWRQLDETQRQSANTQPNIELMQRYPNLIRRPLLTDMTGHILLIGFQVTAWEVTLLT